MAPGTVYEILHVTIPSINLATMAKTQKKTGKGRLDKYYKLAK